MTIIFAPLVEGREVRVGGQIGKIAKTGSARTDAPRLGLIRAASTLSAYLANKLNLNVCMLCKAVRKPKSAAATVEKNRQGSPRYCPFAVKPQSRSKVCAVISKLRWSASGSEAACPHVARTGEPTWSVPSALPGSSAVRGGGGVRLLEPATSAYGPSLTSVRGPRMSAVMARPEHPPFLTYKHTP